MDIQFWGVRGSIPSPGYETSRYGGNTACVSVSLDAKHTLVFDSGSGIRVLGNHPYKSPHVFYIVLSHTHWDHIQGFPFFSPKMDPDCSIVFLEEAGSDMAATLLRQMDGQHFPVTESELKALLQEKVVSVSEQLKPFEATLTRIPLRHIGVCYGYRLEAPSGGLVYMSDNELEAITKSEYSEMVEFASGASVLIHDAQYTNDEMTDKSGWGHSSFEQAIELAIAAQVEKLILFHHDPDRKDSELDEIMNTARRLIEPFAWPVEVHVASEGLFIQL